MDAVYPIYQSVIILVEACPLADIFEIFDDENQYEQRKN